MKTFALLLLLFASAPALAETSGGTPGKEIPVDLSHIAHAEVLRGVPMAPLRYDDALRNKKHLAQGQDLFEQFIRLIFPISGREKRIVFLPLPFWGKKKPQYEVFKWKRFQSAHFDFYAYEKGETILPKVIQYLEQDHDWKNRIIGVENRFVKKVPVIFYQTRRDFEQTHIIGGPIPEGLGGVTEIFSWRRVTFPFEGEMASFEHVARHEGTHVYQIAKGVRRAPLWFIEGIAETLSVKWDAEAELTIRDAYLNGFIFHIPDLWQIQGTWLMYKQGNFIANLLWDEFGEQGLRKIFDGTVKDGFEDALKNATGLTLAELDNKVFAALADRYGPLLTRKDIVSRSLKLDKHKRLLHARGPFYLSGGASGPRSALFLNYLGPDEKVTRKKIVLDRRFRNESLDIFRKGAWMNEKEIIYAIKRSKRDVLRVLSYSFDEKTKKFELGEEEEYSWPELPSLSSPVLVGEKEIAFIGYGRGFTNIYRFDRISKKLTPLTEGKKHYANLDYSPVRKELVFSQEDDPMPARSHYDRNLYTLNIENGIITRLTKTAKAREREPRFSPDGKQVLYVSDAQGTFDLYLYDFDAQESWPLTKMRVGALHPQWGEGNSIVFNAFDRLAPSIYHASLPTPRRILEIATPSGLHQEIKVEKKTIELLPKAESTPIPTSSPKDGVRFVEGKAILHDRQNDYTFDKVAHFGETLLLSASRGLPGSTKVEVDNRSHYFSLTGNTFDSLSSKMVARKGLPKELEERMEKGLEGRPIISAWMASDESQALLLVNNRLGPEAEKFKKEPEVGVLLYHIEEESLLGIESGPLKDLDEHLQWVSFLQGGRILLAIGESPMGPFELYWYDRGKKKYKELDAYVRRFRVSPDHRMVAWRRGSDLYLHDGTESGGRKIENVSLTTSAASAFDFVNDGSLVAFSGSGKLWKAWVVPIDGSEVGAFEFPHEGLDKTIEAAVDPETGNIAIRVRDNRKRGAAERIVLWKKGGEALEDLAIEGKRYDRPVFRKGFLTYVEYTAGDVKGTEWVWKDQLRAPFDDFKTGEILKDGTIVLAGISKFTLYHPSRSKSVTIAGETAGYAVADDKIIYSAHDGKRFQLFSYGLTNGETKAVTAGARPSIEPVVSGNDLVWSTQGEQEWHLNRKSLKKLGATEEIKLTGYDLIVPEDREGETVARAIPHPLPKIYEPRPIDIDAFPGTLRGSPARTKFRLQSLAAAAAFDGQNVRYFITGFADNLFSDRGIFINSVFLENAAYATLGYSNLTNGQTYSLFYNDREEVRNGGIDIAKNFTLDKYRQITVFGDFEVQNYGLANIETFRYVTPEIENRTFYVLKAGLVYAYDVTIWDRHGPISGSRFYFKTEAGFDAGNQGLANVDANIDFRVYNRILRRFGFAHRFVGGTSQGDLPNVFLMGGNISFRGVPFDKLSGQNYWVFSEDMRVPLFDFIGAKFFDPLDQIIGFFTRYFDVRGGMYFDVGAAWFNSEDADVLHSFGYFFNVPTIFGFVFRFNQGIVGEKDIGFWLGFNW